MPDSTTPIWIAQLIISNPVHNDIAHSPRCSVIICLSLFQLLSLCSLTTCVVCHIICRVVQQRTSSHSDVISTSAYWPLWCFRALYLIGSSSPLFKLFIWARSLQRNRLVTVHYTCLFNIIADLFTSKQSNRQSYQTKRSRSWHKHACQRLKACAWLVGGRVLLHQLFSCRLQPKPYNSLQADQLDLTWL